MIWRCNSISCFHFYFLFRNNGKREQLDGNGFCRCYGNCFQKVSFWKYLITSICSRFFLNNYEAPWQQDLKDTLQLKILRTWINMGVEPATRHLAHYYMLLFLSNKRSVDRIIFATIYLPFYLSIFCVSWSSSSTSTLFS